MKKEQAAKKSD